MIDAYNRECLAIDVERRLRSNDVLNKLAELFTFHGPLEHIRSDNGLEFRHVGGRSAKARNLLPAGGGPVHHRALETGVRPDQTPQLAGLQVASTGSCGTLDGPGGGRKSHGQKLWSEVFRR